MLSERDYMKNKPSGSQRLKMRMLDFGKIFSARGLIVILLLLLLILILFTYRFRFH